MNVVDMLEQLSHKYSSFPAVIENGREMSYEELWRRIRNLCRLLWEIDISEGHKVVLMMPSSTNYIIFLMALLKHGVVVTPLSPELTPYELDGIFHNLRPHAVLTTSRVAERLTKEALCLFKSTAIFLCDEDSVRIERQRYCSQDRQCFSMNEYAQIKKTYNVDSVATIHYTYRGIGLSLGAMLTHENYIQGITAYIENTKMTHGERVMSVLPMYYVYPLVGCVLSPIATGATIIIVKKAFPRHILKTIEAAGVDHFVAVPSIFYLLSKSYKKGDYDLGSLVCCITGGAYMSRESVQFIEQSMGIEVQQGYGLTECLPFTWNKQNKPGSLGKPLRHDFCVKIIGDRGNPLGIGEAGEIILSGPTVCIGYYGKPDETDVAIEKGWLHTGDYGFIDKEGYLHFSGLKKQVTKVGGNMVDLEEVKRVLLSHPVISDAVVYAEEDLLWGHTVSADVVLSEGSRTIGQKEIREFCSKKLSIYKVPRSIHVN